MGRDAAYSGKRLLVIEDGHFLDEQTRALLVNMGLDVVCIDEDEAAGLGASDIRPDAAVIDINISAEMSAWLSEMLQELGIPHVFAFAEHPSLLKRRFSSFHLCRDASELEAIMQALFVDDFLN